MKWSPYVTQTADGAKRGEQWRLRRTKFETRGGTPVSSRSAFDEHLASVERSDKAPLIGAPAQYRADVVCIHSPIGHSQWHSAPMLFTTLEAAQQWCELEVRLREVGELA